MGEVLGEGLRMSVSIAWQPDFREMNEPTQREWYDGRNVTYTQLYLDGHLLHEEVVELTKALDKQQMKCSLNAMTWRQRLWFRTKQASNFLWDILILDD